LEDNSIESAEEFWIAMDINACVPDTFFFQIEDNNLVQPDLGEDLSICRGDSFLLYESFSPVASEEKVFANPNLFLIPKAPNFGPSEIAVSPIEVTNVFPEQLGPGIIKSVCFFIEHPFIEDLNVLLRAPNGRFIELTSDNGDLGNGYDVCFVDDPAVDLLVEPGMQLPMPMDNNGWIVGTFRPEGNWDNLWKGDSPTNGTWELIVFDKNNAGFPGIIENFEITFFPLQQVDYQFDNLTGLSCDTCANPWAKPQADMSNQYWRYRYDQTSFTFLFF